MRTLTLRTLSFAAMAAIIFSSHSARSAIVVVSQAIEDINYTGNTNSPSNRFETLLNNTGSNTNRWGASKYDADILGAAAGAPAFTDPSQYQLVSATLTLREQAARNTSINGSQSGRVGAYFLSTAENSDWTVGDLNTIDSGNAGSGNVGEGWFGNTGARPGNFGGGATGANNVDNRSNGAANPLASFLDGVAFQNHTFDPVNENETVTIDLTAGGASLAEIQSMLADWVAGNNAGLGLMGEFGNQSAWESVGSAAGLSVGSTINGDSTFSGVSNDSGLGQDGPGAGTSFLTLSFIVPEPSSFILCLFGLAVVGLRARRV